MAGGTEILQATDIRVAGEGATFGVFEARRGLFPLGGSTVRLQAPDPFHGRDGHAAHRAGGVRRRGSAGRARSGGWSRTVRPSKTALEIAEVICSNGPIAVEAIKRSVRETEGMSEEEGLQGSSRSVGRCSPRRTQTKGSGPSPRSAGPIQED